MTPAQLRYQQAHRLYQDKEYPATVRDHGYLSTNFPDTKRSNGLTQFILNHLKWLGWRATRISATGRLVERPERQESGVSLQTKKWIPGTTRKGSADISSTIQGRSVMWEIKCAYDTPRPEQLKEQELEIRAGGQYFFTHSPEEFFEQYDGFLLSLDPQQAMLL